MIKLLTIFTIFITFILSGCVTTSKINKKVDIHRLDLIQVGQSKNEVVKYIEATATRKLNENEEFWFYKDVDEDDIQVGTVVFDVKTQNVKGITAIPRDTDKEFKLDYLTQVKFGPLEFKKIMLKQCNSHYQGQEEFYVNMDKGVIIEFNFYRQYVQSYIRSTPEYTSKFVDKIDNCKLN
ncbi:MAG: hypothetical protein ACOYOK_08250 [Pseudobdellovibrionaceae bacterium]